MRKFVFIVIAFIVIVIIDIWLNLKIIDVRYDISNALEKERKLTQINGNLRIKLQKLKSPERMEKIGIKEFGLRKPKKEEVVIIR
jgi:cell division protein FtsL